MAVREGYYLTDGDFVSIFGFNGIDDVTVDLACAYLRLVSVPLQSTMSESDLHSILSDTDPILLVATIRDLPLVAELACRHDTIRAIIAMDYDCRVTDDHDLLAEAESVIANAGSPSARNPTVDELVGFGVTLPWRAVDFEANAAR